MSEPAHFCNGAGRVGWCAPKYQKAKIFIKRTQKKKKKRKSDSFPYKYQLIHSLAVGFCSWPLNWADKNKSDTTITIAPTTSSTAGCQQPFPASFCMRATAWCIFSVNDKSLKKQQHTSLLGKNLNIYKRVKNSLMSPMDPYGHHQFMATFVLPTSSPIAPSIILEKISDNFIHEYFSIKTPTP